MITIVLRTPSVLNNDLVAWKNLIFPDCMFVFTVSRGWEMNILHAPVQWKQQRISFKTIHISESKWTNPGVRLQSYQQKHLLWSHNELPSWIIFRYKGSKSANWFKNWSFRNELKISNKKSIWTIDSKHFHICICLLFKSIFFSFLLCLSISLLIW